VQAMARIAAEIENSHILEGGPHYDFPLERHDGEITTARAIAGATVEAVRRMGAPVILTFTSSGSTARAVSSFRPPVPILALTDQQRTYNQLALVWGVVPIMCAPGSSFEENLACGRQEAVRRGLAVPGERMVVTAGYPMHEPGTTNLLQVEVV
jgi:pyruvate kinase